MSKGITLVCGAGGFIGGHLVARLRGQGQHIRAVDIKPEVDWYQYFEDVNNVTADLRHRFWCDRVMDGVGTVYNLAADMGGMGFIETHKAECMLSVLINTHLLMTAEENKVERYFYASSACVYNGEKQTEADVTALKEEDAYPALPEDGYGWEKLFSERMCRHFTEDRGMLTRIARYHNVYGPKGTYDGGREKAPAALCRKIAIAKLSGKGEIDIWGDGEQTRSFMFIKDCIDGTLRLMGSSFGDPLNIGSSELVSINEMVSMIEKIAKVNVKRNYVPGPLGVRGRNSDNTLVRKVLDWEPKTKLEDGLEVTYRWIWDELNKEPVKALGKHHRELREAIKS